MSAKQADPVLAEMREFAASLTTTADAADATVTPGAVLHPAPGVDLNDSPPFIIAPDTYDEQAVWAHSERSDRHLLGRSSLGQSREADALWALIVAAVERASRADGGERAS